MPSRIKSRHCITENQTTLKRLHALNRGDPVAQRKARLEAEMLHQIDQMQLMNILYQSIQYDQKKEKRSCFQYMQDLIDKIYGVEKDNDIDDLMKHENNQQKKAAGGESGNTSAAEEDDLITA